VEFNHLTHDPLYSTLGGMDREGSPPDRIWALVDSRHESLESADIFRDGPFFVVEAASPHPVHQRWANRTPVKYFYMKPWSFAEVLQA